MTKTPFKAHHANSYAERMPKQVPGYAGLHPMMSMLLAEKTPTNGRVLVLGAGGGQEILALAKAHDGWTFDGVDPSADMLELASQTIEPYAERVQLYEGYISDVPQGPFDAATSILIFHFIPLEERLETLKQIRQRLKLGAPFIIMHLSFPQTEPERTLWLDRHIALGHSDDTSSAQIENLRQTMKSRLTILSPEDDEAMLVEAGFSDVSQFYAGMSLKGWVAYAS